MLKRPQPHTLKIWLGNLLLVLGAIFFAYLLVELLLFQHLLPRLPRGLYNHMIRELRPLGESSKQGLLPAPGYVGIAGDSYAQGKGNWFIDCGYDRNSKYAAAHVLHDLLRTDVLSFGRSGAGSVDGLLLEPLQILHFLRKHGFPLTDPGLLLLFFYEGNDVQNNLDFIGRWFPRYEDPKQLDNPAVFQQFLKKLVQNHADGNFRQRKDMPLFGNFILRSIRNVLRNSLTRKYIDVEPILTPGTSNKARIGDKTVSLPDRLQSPPLEVSPKKLTRALYVFEQSVRKLQQLLPNTRLMLVYIPSPLSCYELVSDHVSTYYGGEKPYPKDAVDSVGLAMRTRLRQFAATQHIPFVDSLPDMRLEAQKQPIHGPRDWDHFNRAGYERLGTLLARRIQSPDNTAP